MSHHTKIIFGLLITLGFLALGTIGYGWIEGYTPLDAFYMTVITITTVGYGEVHSLSETGRIFTIFLILFGFGSIGFLAHAFTEAIVDRASNRNYGKRTMKKRIAQLKDHVIICGFGRVGESAAEHFASTGSQFVVIETSEEQLKLIEDYNYMYLEGDATREEVLLAAGIKNASALVTLLDSDPDNLFSVLTARELNPTLHIIARTEVATSESRMLRAGADSIISPYAAAGRSVAEKILSTSVQDETPFFLYDSSNKPSWLTVTEESDLAGHVVEAASTFLNASILGLRRGEHEILLPHGEQQLKIGDELLILSSNTHDEAPTGLPNTTNVKTIVLIDANPVIRRLYTRLFQKEGFRIYTCSTGAEGYERIISEKPDVAVIDYALPDATGLDISHQLRMIPELDRLKILLFTGNEEKGIRDKALTAGVDSVVIKSPDAKEIVNSVKSHLYRD